MNWNRKKRPDHRGKKNNRNLKNCSVCGRVMRNENITMQSNVTGQEAHLECIIQEIKSAESLQQHEKICYLGSGSFGIIKYLNYSASPVRFLIRKRIEYTKSST